MIDQKAKFSNKGLRVEFVGGEKGHSNIKKILQGEIQLIFISPESAIGNKSYRAMLTFKDDKLVGLIVDEVHCVYKKRGVTNLEQNSLKLVNCEAQQV